MQESDLPDTIDANLADSLVEDVLHQLTSEDPDVTTDELFVEEEAVGTSEKIVESRLQSAASIDALLQANSELVSAYQKGSAVDFVFNDGTTEGEAATGESENHAAFKYTHKSSVPVEPYAPESKDTKQTLFPKEFNTGNSDQWISVLRAEFKNLWQVKDDSPLAGITYNKPESVAIPTYFAWPKELIEAKPKAKPFDPISSDEKVTSSWATEYDATMTMHVNTDVQERAGLPKLSFNNDCEDPMFFAYPIEDCQAETAATIDDYSVPKISTESRANYLWRSDVNKNQKIPRGETQTPLVHDKNLLDASKWNSEYDDSFTRPKNVSLGLVVTNSTGDTVEFKDEFILPTPAGVSTTQRNKDAKFYIGEYTMKAPFAVDSDSESDKVVKIITSTATQQVPEQEQEPEPEQVIPTQMDICTTRVYGIKNKFEEPLWVHGKIAPSAIWVSNASPPVPDKRKHIILPPYACDVTELDKYIGTDPDNTTVIGHMFTKDEIQKLMSMVRPPKTAKKKKALGLDVKYKSYKGPNRAIKFGEKYGSKQSTNATKTSARMRKENKGAAKKDAVLFNPRYPVANDKQNRRWKTEASDSFLSNTN